MDLQHPLGQIHPYPRYLPSCNLHHDFPFPFRLNFRDSSILVPRHRHGTGEVPSYSLKLTRYGMRCKPGLRHMVHPMTAVVSLSALEEALDWVSGPPELDAEAFVSRTTGAIYFRNMDGPMEDDPPEDIDNGMAYLPVPHKNDLDLGRRLVLNFIEERAPSLLDQVHELFRKKGAYSRLKGLLQRARLLDSWHEYEHHATREALTRWAAEHGLEAADPGAT